MSLWLRLHADQLNNPKVQTLPAELFKTWINLLCIAKIAGGRLPAVPEIAFRLRASEKATARAIADLAVRRLLDEIEPAVFMPHDWDVHQYNSDLSTERVRKHRAKQTGNVSSAVSNAVSGNVSVTAQSRAYTDTEKRADTQRRAPLAADMSEPISPRFEEFWGRYPRKVNKDAALQGWLSVATLNHEQAIFACLERYLGSDEVARQVVMAADKWLFAQRRDNWAGEWPAVRNGLSRQQENADAFSKA